MRTTRKADPTAWSEKGSARNISGKWPAAAERTRENPDRVVRVCDRVLFAEAFAGGHPVEQALSLAETCRLYVRRTDGGTAHVVALVGMWGEGNAVRYGSASGYGYDKATAAMAGIPVGPDRDAAGAIRPEPVILTDHCGRDRALASDPDAAHPTFREFTIDRLPCHLFVVQ